MIWNVVKIVYKLLFSMQNILLKKMITNKCVLHAYQGSTKIMYTLCLQVKFLSWRFEKIKIKFNWSRIQQ